MISAERLRQILRYDEVTGAFVWLIDTGTQPHVGTLAGSLDNKGYFVIGIDYRRYFAHRLAWLYMTGEMPPKGAYIDHVDGNPQNNAWANLRISTNASNQANSRVRRKGLKGAYWIKRARRWSAQIKQNGVGHHLGCFATEEEAHEAYVKAARERFGEFARAA